LQKLYDDKETNNSKHQEKLRKYADDMDTAVQKTTTTTHDHDYYHPYHYWWYYRPWWRGYATTTTTTTDQTSVVKDKINHENQCITTENQSYDTRCKATNQTYDERLEHVQKKLKTTQDFSNAGLAERKKIYQNSIAESTTQKAALDEKIKNLKDERSEIKQKLKETEGNLKACEKKESDLTELQKEKREKKEKDISGLEKTLMKLFDQKEATLKSIGATSISHALNLAAKLEALSKSYQEYISEMGIFDNYVGIVSKSFEGTLKAIEGCNNLESNMDESDQQIEAVAEWAKKTWPANPEIAENLRKEGLSGRDLAEIVKDDELMEELGIKTKAKKNCFQKHLGLDEVNEDCSITKENDY